jgi:ABC-type uncharacterized transport system permease subunit
MLTAIVLTVITAATPLLLAALGELVAERSGVLNLGVEGMMAVGAVCGFVAAHLSGSTFAGVTAAGLAGALLAVPFAFLVINLAANQVATGLSLTLLGLGLAAMIGESYVGRPGVRLPRLNISGLTDIPFFGPVLFGQDGLVYLSFALVVVLSWFLFRARAGLTLRAVGDAHESAHNLGIRVLAVRWAAVMFGGVCAGLGGGYLSLGYTPLWTENMTAGRGWIALALVVFATWMPWRAAVGAYLFGTVAILGFYAQGAGVRIPSQFISSLPYLATILVLVVISRNRTLMRANTPACLGRPFVPAR